MSSTSVGCDYCLSGWSGNDHDDVFMPAPMLVPFCCGPVVRALVHSVNFSREVIRRRAFGHCESMQIRGSRYQNKSLRDAAGGAGVVHGKVR